MDNNRRYSEEENNNPNPNRRNLAENHRIGREIAQRDPQDRYRSGNAYHNSGEGYDRNQTHYGSRPDSTYRNQQNINYGDNRFGQGDQTRYDNQYRNDNDYRYNMPYRQPGIISQSPYPEDHTRPEQHHNSRMYNERNRYKDEDYRYTSGNREAWQQPTGSFNYDDDDRSRYRDDHRSQDEGFFGRIGNTIGNAWHNMTNSGDDRAGGYNRGYESGPRWADENDFNNYPRSRRNYREEGE